MRLKFILVFFLFSYVTICAQKNEISEDYLIVYYFKLPTNPILDVNKRTYTTNNEALTIHGFSKTATKGLLNFCKNLTEASYKK